MRTLPGCNVRMESLIPIPFNFFSPFPTIMDKNIAALLREDCRTIRVRFENDREGQSGFSKEYTYVTDLDSITVGDYVLVETSNRQLPRIASVSGVDQGVNITPNAEFRYSWVMAKIDLTQHQVNQERNLRIEASVAEAYKNNLRRSYAQQILSGVDETKQLELKALLSKQG